MDTKRLSYIIAIAECQNLSAAARTVNVSQPALSKYLSELEDELGQELFWRNKKQFYLTGAGKIYVEAARKIIDVKEQTYQAIAALSGEYSKTIKIGVTPLRGAATVASIFTPFHTRYPNIDIELKEMYPTELRKSVLNHSVDMAFRTCLDYEDEEVCHISSHEEDLTLFIPSFHPLAPLASADLDHLTRIEFSRFIDTPFVVGEKGSTLREAFDFLFGELNASPTIVYESSNNLIIQNMALNGAGAALLPRSFVEPAENLVYFLLKPNVSLHMSVMLAKDHKLTEEERFLIALNCAYLFTNPVYRYNPNQMAKDIMDEFNITETSFTDLTGRHKAEIS